MISIHKKDNEDYQVPPAYMNIHDELNKKHTKYKRKKIFFFSLMVVMFLCILLYLLLPSFHVSAMSINGLRNLSKDDVYELMEVNDKTSFLTFDKRTSKTKLEENSNGYFLDVELKSNIFSGSITVSEDYPVGKVDNNAYFVSGKSEDEMISVIDNFKINDSRKTELKTNIKNKCEDANLTNFYFKSTTLNDNNKSKVFLPFKDVDSTIVSNIKDVIYTNETLTVMDIIYYDANSDADYLISNVLYDKVDSIFKSGVFDKDTISALRNYFKDKSKVSYKINDNLTKDVYISEVIYYSSGNYDFIYSNNQVI